MGMELNSMVLKHKVWRWNLTAFVSTSLMNLCFLHKIIRDVEEGKEDGREDGLIKSHSNSAVFQFPPQRQEVRDTHPAHTTNND